MKIGVETRCGKLSALNMSTFFLNLDRKITGMGIWKRFGTDLSILNIWLFGCLDKKTNYGRHPVNHSNKISRQSKSDAKVSGTKKDWRLQAAQQLDELPNAFSPFGISYIYTLSDYF